uniref:Uncharacterized protein n=1 Tax=Alexandrium catenella TaxID=2925 RepID=A0A7S1QSL7_ALECA
MAAARRRGAVPRTRRWRAEAAALAALAASCASRRSAADPSGTVGFSVARLGWQQVAELPPCSHRSARRALREDMITQGASSATGLELSPISEGDLMLNTVIFIAGCVPFLYAAYEFWRRIAFGQQFGTGEDPVVFPKPGQEQVLTTVEAAQSKGRGIGKEDKVTIGMDADTNRNRRVLGQDALGLAYILMFLAAASVAVALVSVYPVFNGQVAVGS